MYNFTDEELKYYRLRYLDENYINEEDINLLFKNNDNFEIWGTSLTKTKDDCFLSVFLMMTNDGYLNTSPIICRISLLEPKYLNNTYQPNIKLNKDQKELFIKYISENGIKLYNS